MFRQEIGYEMVWQNDGRRSYPLVSLGAVRGGKTEGEKIRLGCGTGKPENNCYIGFGQCVVFLSKKSVWESLQLGILV